MRRRHFLGTLGKGAVGAGLLPASALQGCVARPDAVSATGEDTAAGADFTAWTWVHGGGDRSAEEWRARFRALSDAGFHAVLVSGGDTGMLSDIARSVGLQFHRWIWIMNRNGDAWAQENHPEWFTVNRNGESTLEHPPYVGYYRWVCPTREPVREYLASMVGEIAADERIDGVHLDYIRHSDVILPIGLWERYDLVQDREYPEFDYCYCEVCRAAFLDGHGVDPMELEDPAADEAWVRFRWDSVTGAVSRMAEAVHEHGKPISAAVFPTPTIARRLVRQAWDEWPVDMLFPMLYHSFYLEDIPWIGAGVREGLAALEGSGTELRAGLYLPSLGPDELAEAVRLSREAGSAGFSTFEMNGLTDEHLAALRGVLGT
jgi:uncharacterized lipoprotein YddW (UPF0748 family)